MIRLKDLHRGLGELLAPGVPLYVADKDLLRQIVGFRFHQGVVAQGRRLPPASLEDVLADRAHDQPLTLVVCPEINNHDNMGAIFRIAVGFGVDAMVLGPEACDPFTRRGLRVSMGAVLQVPIVRCRDVTADLQAMARRWGLTRVATVLDDRAEDLEEFDWPARKAILFGSEGHGLEEQWLELCDRRVTIPMAPSTDSLNVAVAVGVFLYVATRGRPRGAGAGRPGGPEVRPGASGEGGAAGG